MRKGTCRHFNGSGVSDCCEAGVNYRQLVGGEDFGWVTRLPCHTKRVGKSLSLDVVPCDKREEPSAEEIAESERQWKEAFARMEKTLPLIEAMKKRHKGKSAKETVECPVCKGSLTMTIASINGHVWGKCATDGCLAWME